MKITSYLDKNEIEWFYINLQVVNNNKKVLLPYSIDNKMPTMNDFNDEAIINLRKSPLYEANYIAIDTRNIYQIDIDTKDDNDLPYVPQEYKDLCKSMPYFLSSTKQLPHIFVKPQEKITKYNDLLGKDIEILSGKWSFASVDAEIHNHDKPIEEMDVVGCIDNYRNQTKAKKIEEKHKMNNVNMDEIIEIMNKCISPIRANDYNSWIEVGMCLYNIEESDNDSCFKLWDDFSKQSDKYDEVECCKKWHSFRKGGLNVGSLYYFGQQDNPMEMKNIISKRVTNDLKLCDGSHNAIASITYKLLKDEFICATSDGKLWFYFDGNIWKEDKDNLELRRNLSNIVLKQFDRSLHILRMEAPIDDMESDASSNNTLNKKSKMINKIRDNLKDHNFKKHVIQECVEFFYEPKFMEKLDSNPNLIGFNNGVYHIKEKRFIQGNPKDYVSLSTGYNYSETKNNELYNYVEHYFKTLHPIEEQRAYHVKTLSRQLFGDNGMELFHIHCGHNGSAGGGKTKSWEINKLCLGNYVQKFDVGYLVNQKRKEATAPAPEYRLWKGRRMIYCTEPNPGETLNSGVMKDLTGGEQIVYRMLFSNQFDEYIPQFKVHIMTNDLPKIDGTDEGVKRRVRVLPYVSKFVTTDDEVDKSEYIFKADSEITYMFRDNDSLKMEYMRYLLDNYNHSWKYTMTKTIKESSEEYLCENDGVGRFVSEYLERDKDSFVTLKEIKEQLKSCDYYDGKPNVLKNRLERVMKTKCHDKKRFNNKEQRYVFIGYKLRGDNETEDELDVFT